MPKRNRAYTKQDIVNAIDAINNKEMAILEACRTFHIPRSTLQDHIDKNHPNGIGRPSAVDVFVEKRLAIFLTYLTKWKCNLTRDSFCKFSAEVIAETGTQCPRFKDNIPGEHWVRNFVKRHKIEFKFGFTPRSSLFHLIVSIKFPIQNHYSIYNILYLNLKSVSNFSHKSCHSIGSNQM